MPALPDAAGGPAAEGAADLLVTAGARSHQSMVSVPAVMRSGRPAMNST